MAGRFGEDWKSRFHRTHRLSLAQPLVYCRRCIRHCEELRHLVGLSRECLGDAGGTKGNYPARAKSISQGVHPTTGTPLGRAVPIPPGTKGA